jgi:tetratricopeptide (TPR) repeat protein
MLDSQLFGADPIGFHLVNVLLHAVNTSLLFIMLASMTGTLWRSAFVAACFAFHPLHVESVAWIAERKDVLSVMFFLFTLMFYSFYVQQSKRSMYFYSLAAFALGLMAKPMLVTTPVLLLLLDVWPLERCNLRLSAMAAPDDKFREIGKGNDRTLKLLLEKIPFLMFSAVSAVLTLYAHSAFITAVSDLSVVMRMNNALWAMVVYVRKMFLPFDLAMFYPFMPVPFWRAGSAALLLGGTTWLVLKYFRKYPYLATGWFWYIITLAPVIGLVQVGNQSMADRYSYIPHIGLFMMISWGGCGLCARLPGLTTIIKLAAGGAVLLLSISTWIQLGYWRDNVTLSKHALEVTGDNYFAHFNLGLAYEKLGKKELAIAQFKEAIRINPADSQSYFNLGLILANSGLSTESIEYFEKAIQLTPQFATMHYCLGATLGKLGRIDEAIGEYQKALVLEPDNVKCLNNVGTALAQQGRYDEAIPYFARILDLFPNDKNAGINLQLAIRQKNQLPK